MNATSAADRPDAAEQRLPPMPTSVGAARRMVRDLLVRAERHELVETAELLVSEVVTNALLHAGTPIDVAASLDGHRLRVEVGDGSRHLPVRRRYAPTAGTGRGMLMLEQMVDEWGVSRNRVGKTVWFHLATPYGGPAAPPSPEDEPGGRRSATVMVELRDMPLLLHAAWQEHVEALLREYLLVNLDNGDDHEAVRLHAEATDAIAILEEHVPTADVAVEPDRLMEDATEPKVSAAVVRMPVPVASVPHFATLEQTVEAAVELAQRGLVMTPATQPEIQLLRHWMCTQVAEQAVGGAPAPWSVEAEPPAQRMFPLDWDLADVTEAPTGRLAADDANRILAASRTALEILGYAAADDLVGRRILSIIPERYRQAHVAGFTMFLLVGRQPLIDRPVVVPALRADGSEVSVELLVSVTQTGSGRPLFYAELRPVDR